MPSNLVNRAGRPSLHSLRSRLRWPLSIFLMFMPGSIFQVIAKNTNQYTASKSAGTGRPWTDTSAQEMQCFVGLCLYMGIYLSPRVEDYCNRNCVGPYHRITHCMSLMRFQQLKRYVHVSNHETDGSKDSFLNKVQLLLNCFLDMSKKLWIPATNVSVDEMMVMCYGRSSETVRLRNKPIGSGYKNWALCDAGYILECFPRSNRQPWRGCETFKGQLSHASAVVAQLALSLPRHTVYSRERETTMYCIFMDNIFSTPALFKYLREIDIAAVGTVRSNASGFPKCLAVRNKKGIKLPWNALGATPCANGKVLALTWIENGALQMLTTKYKVGSHHTVDRLRRRPRLTSTNVRTVRDVFKGKATAFFPIPTVIDDYNLFMGGVDIADQLRSVYTCHLSSRRIWLPLFFWFLDSCASNACKILAALDPKWQNSRRGFIETLAWSLVRQFKPSIMSESEVIEDERNSTTLSTKIYATKNRALSNFTMAAEPGHFPMKVGDDGRSACVQCRIVAQKEAKPTKVRQKASFKCLKCGHFLCIGRNRNCFTVLDMVHILFSNRAILQLTI